MPDVHNDDNGDADVDSDEYGIAYAPTDSTEEMHRQLRRNDKEISAPRREYVANSESIDDALRVEDGRKLLHSEQWRLYVRQCAR
eukprot:gene16060-biopygen3286